MTPSKRSKPSQKFYGAAQHHLDNIVITIEFTLISIVAGLTLFPLMDNSAPIISSMQFEFWPYILTNLVLTMFFWAVVIGHALTFVGWPIDIAHNLMYMALFLALGIQIHFLTSPLLWFIMCCVVAIISGLLARYDLGLILARSKSTSLGAAKELYAAAARRQWLHIYSSIFSVITIGGATIAIYKFPELFISQRWHLIPITAVLLWTVLLLANEFRMFRGLREGIMATVAKHIAAGDGEPRDSDDL